MSAVAEKIDARPLSPEMRARIIVDAMGLGSIEDRKKRVYEAALEQIRNAVAAARAGTDFYAT